MSRLAAALAAMLLALSGCSENREAPPPETAEAITVTDDEGVETTLEEPPDRIVTFAPSHTEIVFALGLGDRVVGVSGPFDDFPPEAQGIEQVAGAAGVEPNSEQVVALEADVVLTGFIGGEWKPSLRDLGVPVFTTLAESLEDAIGDIETIGELLGVEDRAAQLADGMRAEADGIEERLAGVEPVSCFLDLGDLFTVGPGSVEYDLLERAGCDPITSSGDSPYPQWSIEQVVADDPDVYLVSEGIPVEQVREQEGIRDLTAVREGRLHQVDPDLISRPGPRMVAGLDGLAAALLVEA